LEINNNQVKIKATVTVDLTANGSNTPMSQLQSLSIKLDGQEVSKEITTATTYSHTFDIVKSRNELNTGNNIVELKAYADIETIYKEIRNIYIDKPVTVTVEETKTPYISVSLSADPSSIEFTNDDVNVTLTCDYQINSWKDAIQISKWVVDLGAYGSFDMPNELIGRKTLDVVIPTSFMNGYDERTQKFDAQIDLIPSFNSLISSIPLLEAASISIISIALPELISKQEEHLLQGSPFCGFSQLILFANNLAIVVLPDPRGPERI